MRNIRSLRLLTLSTLYYLLAPELSQMYEILLILSPFGSGVVLDSPTPEKSQMCEMC